MKKIKILCADGLEECEALIIYDLLTRANIDVKLVNIHNKENIISSHNLNFKTQENIDDLKEYDGIVLPGGLKGVENLRSNNKVLNLIKQASNTNKLIASICAAPDILKEVNLVDDGQFTCYPGCDYHGKAKKDDLVIKDNIITAKALGASFKLAFEIIKYLSNKEDAQNIFNQIYYH